MFKFLRNSTSIYIQKVYYNYYMLIHMFHVYRVNYSRIRYAVYALQVTFVLVSRKTHRVVSENMKGTLTSSDSNFVHTSTFIILLYQSCIIIIFEYSKFFRLENNSCVVAVEFDIQRIFFRNIIDFFFHNIIAKFLSLYIYTKVLFEF